MWETLSLVIITESAWQNSAIIVLFEFCVYDICYFYTLIGRNCNPRTNVLGRYYGSVVVMLSSHPQTLHRSRDQLKYPYFICRSIGERIAWKKMDPV